MLPDMYIRGSILIILLVSVVLLISLVPQEEAVLEVTFFDVGQGDAALIETPEGIRVLIDGGSDPSILRHLSKEMGFFERTIDMVVATHPDTDHIGGLLDVFDRYRVRSVVMTKHKGQTETADAFYRNAHEETSHIYYARRGMSFVLEEDMEFEILFPDRAAARFKANAASVVTRLTYKDIAFLFMGDAPKSIERYLVSLSERGNGALKSEVLKVGHHGSDTSTSQEFLSFVDPDHAVISAGADNSYGHPHEEVLDALNTADVSTKNTAQSGSVVFASDGARLWLK